MRSFSILSSMVLMVALAACSSNKGGGGSDPAPAAPQEPQQLYTSEGAQTADVGGLIVPKNEFRQFLRENNDPQTAKEIRGLVRNDAITNKTFVFDGNQPVAQPQQSNGQYHQGGYYPNQQQGGGPFAGQQGGMQTQQGAGPFVGQQGGTQNTGNQSSVAYKFIFDDNGELHVDVWVDGLEYQTKTPVAYKLSANEEVNTSSDEETNIRPLVIDNFIAESVTDKNSKLKFQDTNGGIIFLAKVTLSADYTRAEMMSLPATHVSVKTSGKQTKKSAAKQDSLSDDEVAAIP